MILKFIKAVNKSFEFVRFFFCFVLPALSTHQVQMESETIGQDPITLPGTSVWVPHHLRPQVTSVTCAELHQMPSHPFPGRVMWGRWAGDGNITSC